MKNSTQYSHYQIGQTLLRLRHARNEKQQTVARAAGISASMISKIECGKYKNVTLEILTVLANYYNVALSDLVAAKEPLAVY